MQRAGALRCDRGRRRSTPRAVQFSRPARRLHAAPPCGAARRRRSRDRWRGSRLRLVL